MYVIEIKSISTIGYGYVCIICWYVLDMPYDAQTSESDVHTVAVWTGLKSGTSGKIVEHHLGGARNLLID